MRMGCFLPRVTSAGHFRSLPLACHRAMGTVYSCPLYFEGALKSCDPVRALIALTQGHQGDQDVCGGPGAALAILTLVLR